MQGLTSVALPVRWVQDTANFIWCSWAFEAPLISCCLIRRNSVQSKVYTIIVIEFEHKVEVKWALITTYSSGGKQTNLGVSQCVWRIWIAKLGRRRGGLINPSIIWTGNFTRIERKTCFKMLYYRENCQTQVRIFSRWYWFRQPYLIGWRSLSSSEWMWTMWIGDPFLFVSVAVSILNVYAAIKVASITNGCGQSVVSAICPVLGLFFSLS